MSDTGYTHPPDTTLVYNITLDRFQEVNGDMSIPNKGRSAMRRPPTHPGEIFEEEFRKHMQISQAESARRMGMSANRLNEIVKGKRGVTAETAVLLSQLCGTSSDFWMNLQTDRDLWFAERKLAK